MQTARTTGIAALLLLALSASARTDELRVDLRGDAPIRTATLQVEGLGTLLVRAEERGQLVWIEALAADGSVVGRAQSVRGLAETPLSVRAGAGRQKLIVVLEGAE